MTRQPHAAQPKVEKPPQFKRYRHGVMRSAAALIESICFGLLVRHREHRKSSYKVAPKLYDDVTVAFTTSVQGTAARHCCLYPYARNGGVVGISSRGISRRIEKNDAFTSCYFKVFQSMFSGWILKHMQRNLIFAVTIGIRICRYHDRSCGVDMTSG